MRFKGIHRAAIVCAVLPLAAACGSADAPDGAAHDLGADAQTDGAALGVVHDTPPLYTIELGDSTAVYLWEHKPGLINFSESAPAGAPVPHLTYDLSGRVTEIFQALRPGEAVPEVLGSAQEREDQRLAALAAAGNLQQMPRGELVFEEPVLAPSPEVPLRDDTAVKLVPKDAFHQWFEDNLCRTSVLARWPIAGTVDDCWLHRTNGGTFPYQDRAELLAALMSYRGTVSFALTVFWQGGGTSVKIANVSSGFWYAWEFYDDSINDKHDYEFTVGNAVDDGYHRATVSARNFCRPGCFPNGAGCGCPAGG